MNRGKNTYQEIMSQGNTWKLTIESLDSQFSTLIEWLRQPYKEVIFIGCGSTHYLSLSAAFAWNAITGTPARGIPSSDLWLFPKSVISEIPTLLIAVSRSGETSETLHAVDTFYKQTKSEIISISCYEGQELINKTPHKLIVKEGEEKSVAQTRSFTSMLILAQYAAVIAANNKKLMNDIRRLPYEFGQSIKEHEALAYTLGNNENFDHFVFLGSGYNYGLACEAMLKMKEMSLSVSEAFQFLEFRHGPKSLVSPRTLIIGLINDEIRDYEIAVLHEMKTLGASVLAIDETSDGINADYVIELNSGFNTLTRGPLLLPVLQLLAYYRSMSKGLNPDRPKNLEAVVKL